MGVRVEVDRRLLLEHQVIEWDLPPAPSKLGDSRTAAWSGLGQVELDAIDPKKLQLDIEDAILEHRDEDLYTELMDQQQIERGRYIDHLKKYVKNIE